MVRRRAARAGEGTESEDLALAWKVASEVVDPGIPVLTIADLGVLRDVRIVDGVVEATITPTHTGCPAMNLIALNVEAAIEHVGFYLPRIKTSVSPAWTAEWMMDEGKARFRAYRDALPAAERCCKACGASFDYFKNL